MIWVDDLGDAGAEAALILAALSSHYRQLAARAFLRVSAADMREARR
jgi:hypothetical protein